MSPKPRRQNRRGGSGWAWIFILLLLMGATAWWIYSGRPAFWNRTSPAKTAAVKQVTAPPASVAATACGGSLPRLPGGALAASRQAEFATLEQLSRKAPAATVGKVFRIEAMLAGVHLASQGQDELVLQSLVHPGQTMTAWLPPGACASNQEDGALFDEMREDLQLRFGAAAAAPDTKVVVTGVAEAGPQGLQLRPVLDWRVE